jgi:glycosyltransferase involved in cell wall biosynthesis
MQLEDEGHEVEVLSPWPSAAHHHLDFHSGPRGGLALAKRVRRYDKLIVQWHPVFFYARKNPEHRVLVDLALQTAFRLAREVEVWVHEFEYHDTEGDGVRARTGRALWRSVDAVHFHSEVERDRFLAATGVDPALAHISEHGASFRARTTMDRAAARRSLGIPADQLMFLTIGFIQRHKGFDRAIQAFSGLGEHGARLDVVGAPRVDEPDFLDYADELEQLCAATPGATFHRGYVSDEEFDRWIVASDVVVLPYREIWSSGVLERAALLDRPVIATDVGGLGHQAEGRSATLVADDRGLHVAMWAVAGLTRADADPNPVRPWPAPGPDLWSEVQAEVRERAAGRRGGALALDGDGERGPAGALTSGLARRGTTPRPDPSSDRIAASLLKRAIAKLTSWQQEPVAQHVDALRMDVVEALDQVERRLRADRG